MRPSPYKMIGVGFACAGLSGYVTIQMYTSGSTNLSTNDLEYAIAPLDRQEQIREGKNSTTLQLWLQGQPLPFVASGIVYPRVYDRAVLSSLAPGAKIRIGYQRKYIAKPNIDGFTNQAFYYIDTLEINDLSALTLEASNGAKAQNAQIGKIFMPIMFLLGTVLLTVGIKDLKKAKIKNKVQPQKVVQSRNKVTK
jgi:hypothetical protein